MTLSPDSDRRVIARPDLPPYRLNDRCAHLPHYPAMENHHLWRRSTGQGFREAWWVELSDGTILPNRIGLSTTAHRSITVNEAHIRWLGKDEGWAWFERDGDEWELVHYIECLPSEPDEQLSFLEPAEQPKPHVPEGEPCPSCGRRVPHAKKPSSPKTKVTSVRVPVADAEVFEETLDAAAKHLGIDSRPHHKYWTLSAGLALVLQAPANVLEKS